MTVRELQTARPVGGPRRSQSAVSARHAPQVVWRKREERGGKGRAGLPGQRKARASGRSPPPCHSSPTPSFSPTRGMTPKPEPRCARRRVGGRAATQTSATLPPWEGHPGWRARPGLGGEGEPEPGEAGAEAAGPGRCARGPRGRGPRAQRGGHFWAPALGRAGGVGCQPGGSGRSPRRGERLGGHFLATPLAEPGLLVLGRRRRASRTAARVEGETRSPVRRRGAEPAPRARSKAAPGELAGAGPARGGPGEAGTPVPGPHSLPTPIKVEWPGRAGAALAAAASLRPRS